MFAGYLFFLSSSVECDGIPGLGLYTEMDGKYVLNCASHFVTIHIFDCSVVPSYSMPAMYQYKNNMQTDSLELHLVFL